MDQNKNWVNYKPFDAYGQFKLCTAVIGTSTLNYTCDNNGLYLLLHAAYNTTINQQSTAATTILINNSKTSDGFASVIVYKAVIGNTIKATQSVNSYGPTMVLYYLTNIYENVTLNTYVHRYNSAASLSMTNATNRILAGVVSGSSGFSNVTMTDFSTQQYATDGAHHGCISTVNDSSSGSVSVTGSSGSAALVVDLQLQ